MKNNKTIDLNADLGEYSNEDELNNEISLIHHITSANIACCLLYTSPSPRD